MQLKNDSNLETFATHNITKIEQSKKKQKKKKKKKKNTEQHFFDGTQNRHKYY